MSAARMTVHGYDDTVDRFDLECPYCHCRSDEFERCDVEDGFECSECGLYIAPPRDVPSLST